VFLPILNSKVNRRLIMVDNEKAPNCPVCGEFMDKVVAQVTAQAADGGKAQVGKTYICWVCTNKHNDPI
jgi:hypothetical protein